MESDVAASWSSLLTGYPITIALPVQWGDQDSFRHVNNVVYFRWYESARIAYARRIGLMGVEAAPTIGPILAATSNNYRRQLNYPDTVHVGVRIAEIGGASMSFEHLIVSESQAVIAAEGTSTIVLFDYTKNRPVRVPDTMRQAIALLEGRPV